MVEPGIELGTSRLVVRSYDHQATRLVNKREYLLLDLSINPFLLWEGVVYMSLQDKEKPSYVPLTIGPSSVFISLA